MSANPMTHRTSITALVLAAGRGERMRPLTDTCPKPLLHVHGKPLLQHWIEKLERAGTTDIVLNTAWLGEQIDAFAQAWPQRPGCARLQLSSEGRDFGHALETAGGIARALPLLATQADTPFWVVAGDVFAPDFVPSLQSVQQFSAAGQLAHLWLVPNPAHKPEGDFGIDAEGLASLGSGADGRRHTFSTVALYRRAFFESPWCPIAPGNPQGLALPLRPLLERAIAAGQVGASLYTGRWTDVGTPERLAALNAIAP